MNRGANTSVNGNEVDNRESFAASVFVIRRAAIGRRCSLRFFRSSFGCRAQLCNLRSTKTPKRESGLSAIESDANPEKKKNINLQRRTFV